MQDDFANFLANSFDVNRRQLEAKDSGVKLTTLAGAGIMLKPDAPAALRNAKIVRVPSLEAWESELALLTEKQKVDAANFQAALRNNIDKESSKPELPVVKPRTVGRNISR